MSSSDGLNEPRDAVSHHATRSSSRTSSATQDTLHSKLSILDSLTTHENHLNDGRVETIDESGSPNLTNLYQQGLKHVSDPQEGRRWLAKFGNYHRGTEVSEHLTSINDNSSDETQSILSLLAKFVTSWFGVAQQKRKADRSTRSALLQEQEDFLWLLQFIADYLSTDSRLLSESELTEVCLSITQICQQTSRADDINASVKVLHNVMIHGTFPLGALKDALEVFCATTIILAEPIEDLAECIRLLLVGPIREQAVTILLEFVTIPTVQNNSHHINYARGAIRQLRLNIDLIVDDGTHVIDLPRLLDTLYQASKCCIFRHCTEVLSACDTILTSQQLQTLISTDFSRFLSTIDNCTRTSLPRPISSRSLVQLRSPDRDQVVDTERQNTKYLAERKACMKSLFSSFESVWPNLPSAQQNMVSGMFMEYHKDLNDSQISIVISHLEHQGRLSVEAEEWGQRIGKIYEQFVRSPKISTPNRLRAANLCVSDATQAARYTDESNGNRNASILASGQNIVDRLINLVGSEITTAVVHGILSSLVELAFCTDGRNKYPYTDLIIRRLVWFVKNERDGEDDVYDEHVHMVTIALQQIFHRSLSSDAYPASKAYDALLELAGPTTRSRRCRLVALRSLIRLRCDAAGMIYLQIEPDSQYIAAALCRTKESKDVFANDTASSQSTSGGGTNPIHFTNPRQLWSYPSEDDMTREWPRISASSVVVRGIHDTVAPNQVELRLSDWLVKVIECLQSDSDWETISFIVVHLGAQLFNTMLFSTSLEALVKLRQIICTQVINEKFKEPPSNTGLRKSDTALCMFNMLTSLIPYATMKAETIQKGFGDDLVRAFLSGIGSSWEGTAKGCIHALCVCSLEVPASVASLYPNILTKMSRNMTQSHLTIHILEFLTQVARLPEIHSNFTQDEITMIFGICLQFLEKAREHHSTLSAPSPRSGTPARHSGVNLRKPPYRAAMLQDVSLPQYASALAYHTMIFWFLSLKLDVRAKYVSWIVPRLIWKNSQGEDTIDEQSQVFVDMMQRTAFSDLGETVPNTAFAHETDGAVSSSSWIVGLSIVTAETAGQTGITQITKRQASGSTHAVYQQLTAPLPAHHVPSHTEIPPGEDSNYGATEMLPSHILLQMAASAAPTSPADQPIPLPKEDFVTRALNVFDKIPTVDSHKLGIVYVAPGQTKDTDFLANTTGSLGYQQFVEGLGYVVSLEPPLAFNPQGLQHPRDGQHTIAWRDRVTEIVYHISTFMPNNIEDDPDCNMKKAHIGNCHVMIVFNESGIPWDIGNFPSAVTFVHVVITPTNRAIKTPMEATEVPNTGEKKTEIDSTTAQCDFYDVHVITKENYPNVSPAADPKVISKERLPEFVRMFALNANVFSQAKVASDRSDDEFPSTWRARLQAIKTLKQRVIERSGASHGQIGNGPNLVQVGGGRRTPMNREESQDAEKDKDKDKDKDKEGMLAQQLDFGKWTL